MKRTAVFLCLVIFLAFILSGCSLIKIEEEPRKALEYVIVKQEDIPKEALALIDEKKTTEFQMIYQVEKDLYLIKGYGRQMSGGCSIQVEEVSLSSNAVFFKTKLLGPENSLENSEPSYPYIVVKIDSRKEEVNFI